MTNRELFEVLNRTKSVKAYIKSQEPVKYPDPEIEVIDWHERKKMKNKLFLKYLSILGIALFTTMILFALPLVVAYPPYGKAFLLGVPPMFLVGLTWMAGAWWAWDKARAIFMAVTVGAMPIRIGFGLLWSVMILSLPDVNEAAYVFSMMLYWLIFTTIEISMIVEFTKKIQCTAQLESNNE